MPLDLAAIHARQVERAARMADPYERNCDVSVGALIEILDRCIAAEVFGKRVLTAFADGYEPLAEVVASAIDEYMSSTSAAKEP